MALNFGRKRQGSRPFKICEPSKGNNGSKLKNARKRLILILINKNSKIGKTKWEFGVTFPFIKWNINPKTNADTKFDAGPARETNMLSRLGFLKFAALTGTGFPHPKWANIKQITPIGSRCAIGFSVNLPSCLAVGSPSLFAVHA